MVHSTNNTNLTRQEIRMNKNGENGNGLYAGRNYSKQASQTVMTIYMLLDVSKTLS